MKCHYVMAATAILLSTSAANAVDTSDYWYVCRGHHYVPRAEAAPHAGEIAVYFWSDPFQSKVPLFPSGGIKLNPRFAQEYAAYVAAKLDRDVAYLNVWECQPFGTREEAAEGQRSEIAKDGGGVKMAVPAPPRKLLAELAGEPEVDKPKTAPKPQPAGDGAAEPATKDPSAAEIAAKERTARAAEREAEFQRKQAVYEAELAEQKRKVAEYEQAKADVARQKGEQAAAAKAAQDAFRKQQEAHDAEVAKYESELAAQKVRADFDKRRCARF